MIAPGRRPAPGTLLVALGLSAALGLAGCASADDTPGTGSDATANGTASSTPSSTGTTPSGGTSASDGGTGGSSPAASDGVTIAVTFDGDTVTPHGTRVDVPLGEDVTLDVTADQPGEIHVHSTPEQELDYDAGTTTLVVKDLDQPGIVEVESHALDKVIVQLQVQ